MHSNVALKLFQREIFHLQLENEVSKCIDDKVPDKSVDFKKKKKKKKIDVFRIIRAVRASER